MNIVLLLARFKGIGGANAVNPDNGKRTATGGGVSNNPNHCGAYQ
jgi:hypothetical protein